AVDQLGHQEQLALVISPEIMDLHHRRVPQPRAHTGLLNEQLPDLVVASKTRVHALDGDGQREAIRAVIQASPHHRHPALPHARDELIFASEALTWVVFGHAIRSARRRGRILDRPPELGPFCAARAVARQISRRKPVRYGTCAAKGSRQRPTLGGATTAERSERPARGEASSASRGRRCYTRQ